jgi:hypothetical protein
MRGRKENLLNSNLGQEYVCRNWRVLGRSEMYWTHDVGDLGSWGVKSCGGVGRYGAKKCTIHALTLLDYLG